MDHYLIRLCATGPNFQAKIDVNQIWAKCIAIANRSLHPLDQNWKLKYSKGIHRPRLVPAHKVYSLDWQMIIFVIARVAERLGHDEFVLDRHWKVRIQPPLVFLHEHSQSSPQHIFFIQSCDNGRGCATYLRQRYVPPLVLHLVKVKG